MPSPTVITDTELTGLLKNVYSQFREKVQKVVARGIASEAAELKQDVRSHVAGQMAVVKKSFIKGFTAKVLDRDPNRYPALYVGSRIPWSRIHETGGVIAGRLLIPLHGRVGRKRFKAQPMRMPVKLLPHKVRLRRPPQSVLRICPLRSSDRP
mgnify:CR=1 FL=1